MKIGALGQAPRRLPLQVRSMEGGLLIHAAYALVLIWVWVWRRWFEEEGPRSEEFERFCAERPLLATFSVQPGSEAVVALALRAALPKGETLPTLGAWPWIHYVLRVEVEARPGSVRVFVGGCRPLRTREPRPVALTSALADVAHERAPDVRDSWLYGAARVDVSGRTNGEHGWRFSADAAKKARFVAWERRPAWALSVPECESTAASRTPRAPKQETQRACPAPS